MQRMARDLLHSGHMDREVFAMNTKQTAKTLSTSMLILLGLCACADMSRQDRNTAIGAAAGAAGGAVLTHGSAAGTVGGAAVGGVVGHEVDKKDKHD